MNKVSSMVTKMYTPPNKNLNTFYDSSIVERKMLDDFGYKNKRAMIKDMKKMLAKDGTIDMNLKVIDNLVECDKDILKITYKSNHRSIDFFYRSVQTCYSMRMDVAKTQKGKILIFAEALQAFGLFYDNNVHNPFIIATVARGYASMYQILTEDKTFKFVNYNEIVSAFMSGICYYHSINNIRIMFYTFSDVLKFKFCDKNQRFEDLRQMYRKPIVSPKTYRDKLIYMWQQTKDDKYLIYAVVYDVGFIDAKGNIEETPQIENEDAIKLLDKYFKY